MRALPRKPEACRLGRICTWSGRWGVRCAQIHSHIPLSEPSAPITEVCDVKLRRRDLRKWARVISVSPRLDACPLPPRMRHGHPLTRHCSRRKNVDEKAPHQAKLRTVFEWRSCRSEAPFIDIPVPVSSPLSLQVGRLELLRACVLRRGIKRDVRESLSYLIRTVLPSGCGHHGCSPRTAPGGGGPPVRAS